MNLRKDHYRWRQPKKITGKTKTPKLGLRILTLGYLARPGLPVTSREFAAKKSRDAAGQSSAEGSWKASTGSRLVFWRRFKESFSTAFIMCGTAPGLFSFYFLYTKKMFCKNSDQGENFPPEKRKNKKKTTLGGGSLGSCVDEERSQLRELM